MDELLNYLPNWAWLTICGVSLTFLGYTLNRTLGKKKGSKLSRAGWVITSVLFTLVAFIGYFAQRPRDLVAVPDLANLSVAEAQGTLDHAGLQAQANAEQTSTVEVGIVILGTEVPSPGTRVKPGSSVRFAYAADKPVTPPPIPIPPDQKLTLIAPKDGSQLGFRMGDDGLRHAEIKGAWSKLSGDSRIAVWIHPTSPGAPDMWFPQSGPNGARTLTPNGSWTGRIQLGNSDYPPHEGDTFDLAVSIMKRRDFETLVAKLGEVKTDQPEGDSQFIVKGVKTHLVSTNIGG